MAGCGYVTILATYFLVYNLSDTLTNWRLLDTDPVSSLRAEETLILMAQSWHQPPRHEAPGHTIIALACSSPLRAGEAIAGLLWQPQVTTNPEFSWLLFRYLLNFSNWKVFIYFRFWIFVHVGWKIGQIFAWRTKNCWL